MKKLYGLSNQELIELLEISSKEDAAKALGCSVCSLKTRIYALGLTWLLEKNTVRKQLMKIGRKGLVEMLKNKTQKQAADELGINLSDFTDHLIRIGMTKLNKRKKYGN